MFENLKDKLQTVFSVLGKKGILTEKDIDNALILAKKIIDNKNIEGSTIDLRINNQIILSNE